jgi:hypothetical protein
MSEVKATIYCDYDGVLVDFEAGAYSYLGHEWDKPLPPEERVERNRKTFGNDTFWQSMAPMNDFHELWNYILPYTPHILTAYPYRHNRPDGVDVVAIAQKGKWEWNELHTRVPRERFHCVDRDDKALYAVKAVDNRIVANILIDDTLENCRAWTANRGIAIFHENAKDTLIKLEQLRNIGLL